MRAVDGAPSISPEVERDKEIAREERSQNSLAFASMMDRLRTQRQKRTKVLSSETNLCNRFPMRLSVDGVPMLSFMKDVTGTRHCPEADCHATTPFFPGSDQEMHAAAHRVARPTLKTGEFYSSSSRATALARGSGEKPTISNVLPVMLRVMPDLAPHVF